MAPETRPPARTEPCVGRAAEMERSSWRCQRRKPAWWLGTVAVHGRAGPIVERGNRSGLRGAADAVVIGSRMTVVRRRIWCWSAEAPAKRWSTRVVEELVDEEPDAERLSEADEPAVIGQESCSCWGPFASILGDVSGIRLEAKDALVGGSPGVCRRGSVLGAATGTESYTGGSAPASRQRRRGGHQRSSVMTSVGMPRRSRSIWRSMKLAKLPAVATRASAHAVPEMGQPSRRGSA
jgi:hypothetical protein